MGRGGGAEISTLKHHQFMRRDTETCLARHSRQAGDGALRGWEGEKGGGKVRKGVGG